MYDSEELSFDERVASLRQAFLDGEKEYPFLGHAIIRFAEPEKNIACTVREFADSKEWRGATNDEWRMLLGNNAATHRPKSPFEVDPWFRGDQLGESLDFTFDSAFY